MSLSERPASFNALGMACTGLIPNSSGSTPAVAYATKRASGFNPRDLARASLITTVAAAPSLIGELFPAVTVPLAWKAGFSLARTSRDVSARGSSSVSKRKVCVVGFGEDLDWEEAPLPLVGSEEIFT